MKNRFLTMTFCLCMVAFTSKTMAQVIDIGECGASGNNLTWALTGDGVLTIMGSGAMADVTNPSYQPWFSHRNSIKSVIINDGATIIGEFAFEGCNQLSSVNIPNSVTMIGFRAFRCSNLTTIICMATTPPDLSEYGSVFRDVPSTAQIFVPCNSVSAYQAKSGWNDFTITGIPYSGTCGANLTWELSCDSVLTISGSGAMTDYSGTAVPWYSQRENIKTLIIENGITTIGNRTFMDCKRLTEATIPNSITSIGNAAFYNCNRLSEVTIPNLVTFIDAWAFAYCFDLTEVIIPNSVESIGNRTFYDCKKLTEVTIGNMVTLIDESAFGNCTGLTKVTNLSIEPQNINSDVFSSVNLDSVTLVVPACALEDYQNADVWSDFGTIEEEFPCEENDIKVFKADNISIYPNPVKNELFISNNEQLIINNVKITDLTGRTVQQFNDSTHKINVSNLPQGVYLVKIGTDKGVVMKRVVKN